MDVNCKGSYVLGTACGLCKRCEVERESRATRLAGDEWNTIDSAPTDSTDVLLYIGRKGQPPVVGFFGFYHPNSPGKPCWRDSQSRSKLHQPAAWVPLPRWQ